MSRSTRQKEKYGKSNDLSQDNCIEGTAARTRPFSLDEIMLRRKNKKQSGDVKEGPGGSGNIVRRGISEKVSDLESDKLRHKDSVPSAVKHASEDFVKVSYGNKEDIASIKEGKLVKGKDRERLESKIKSRATLNKNITEQGKIDGQVHGKRKTEELSSNDSENESEKKHSRGSVGKNRFADKSRGKSEKESKRKHQNENNDMGVHRERKNDELTSNDSGNKAEKRHSRDLVGKYRYTDKIRGKSEKESRKKHQNEDEERARDRNASKKHGSGKWHESEFSERKEKKESSQVRHEESRPKRRRSRSRDHDKDKGRRSISLSPRVHKRTTYDMGEHGDLSSQSSKDRAGRSHIDDVDRKRISSNGSSSHYRQHGESSSGLGGYSPRKRRTEAAVKASSPTNHSPEKRSAGWDLPPAGTESSLTGFFLSSLQSSNQPIASNTSKLSSVVSVTSIVPKPVVGVFPSVSTSIMNASIDSIHLTQSTRPMRRLYIENLPLSASEKAVMECLNNFLLSSGANHIQGAQPCISCIIHKEKGQALVEFLTPADASAALSFDGRTFAGSILKIRRPKDYIELTTGVPEKSVSEVDSISDIVKDSPHKIFIGGISKVISSEMIKGIVSAFGPLKAFHFEVIADLNERCAFLEYVDHSVTLKACAGLNGMRLGEQMLTVVQAIPDVSSAENIENQPFYGIPEHAKPLLEKPTQVLKLRNVLDPEGLSSMSEQEVEEILEDLRLECARFGTVKSLNVVKRSNCSTNCQTCEVIDNTDSVMEGQDMESDDKNKRIEMSGEGIDCESVNVCRSEPSSSAREHEVVNKAAEGNNSTDNKLGRSELSSSARELEEANKAVEGIRICDDELAAPGDRNVAAEHITCLDNYGAIIGESPNQLSTSMDQSECHDDKVADVIQKMDFEMENKLCTKEELKLKEVNGKLDSSFELDCSVGIDLDALKKDETKEHVSDLGDVFEPGCVLVEYRRAEASHMAAHCLHGRLFDDRIVTAGYVSRDVYQARFSK